MRLFAVTSYGYRKPLGVTVFHQKMFHGEEAQGHHRAGNIEQPLRLWKNIHNMAKIFQPGADLVVSEEIVRGLKGLSRVRLEQVIFQSVFEYPYEVGDDSFVRDFPDWRKWEYYDWYQQPRFSHDPSLAVPHAPYFEIRAPLKDPMEPPSDFVYSGSVRKSPDLGAAHIQVAVSRNWYEHCGILWNKCIVVADWLAEQLAPHLDDSYFWMKPFRAHRVRASGA